MIDDKSKRVPLSVLETTEDYQRLTAKQKLFVATYIQCGIDTGVYDSIAAAQTAYKCKTPEVARVMSYALMANIRIVAVLNLHFAREPIEDFLVTLNRAITNKRLSIAQFKALQLKANILGFTSRLPGANENAAAVIPQDVLDRAIEERKAHRKPRAARKPAEPPTDPFDYSKASRL